MKSKKLLLSLGLLLVFFNGLIRLPAIEDYLFPEDLFKTRLLLAMKTCNTLDNGLAQLSEELDDIEWLAEKNFHNKTIPGLYEPPSKFSQICGEFFPKYCWDTELFLAKIRCVDVQRKLKYLHALLDFLSLISDNHLVQSNNNNLINQSSQPYYNSYQLNLIKAKLTDYENEIKVFSNKLMLLENKEISP